MTRAEAWGDAGEIMKEYSNIARLWPYCEEIALRTSLTQGEAEARVVLGIQETLGELLYEFGDYGKGDDG